MAVGMILGHDVTKIITGKHKGPMFKRGHIIREDEIDKFLNIGKEHVYVIDLRMGYVHEDEAAGRTARAAAGQGIRLAKPSEGRVNMIAEYNGLLKVKPEALAHKPDNNRVIASIAQGEMSSKEFRRNWAPDQKNIRNRPALLSQLQRNHEDHIVDRVRPNC